MITFDADLTNSGDMSEENLQNYITAAMDNIAEAARDEWVRLAQDSDLTVTKKAYIAGIGDIEAPSPTERTISLNGWLPNALEEGTDSFDMKPGLLKGKDHVAIPFLYGKPGQTDKPALTTQTFNKVKTLKRGERFSTKLGRSKYEGLQKASKSDGRNTFIKFRTVSVNSPKDSWIHPGLTPLLLENKVQEFIEENMANIINNISMGA